MAHLHLPELSAWLGGKVDISEEKRERVSLWIGDIAQMIAATGSLNITVDSNDIDNVCSLVQKINDAELQLSSLDSLPAPESNGSAAGPF